MNILQLFFDALGRDPRPTRFYRELCAMGEVTVCSAPPVPGFESVARFVDISPPRRSLPQKASRAANLLARRYEADIWTAPIRKALASLKNTRFDLIVCHDALLLPLAFAVRDAFPGVRCPVVMDAREYYPRQFEHSFIWRLMLGGLNGYLCRRYLPRADLVFTVSPGLADAYREEYGVACELLPSYPDFRDIAPHATDMSCIRCIHHGVAAPGRKLELMIDAFLPLGERFTFDLMLVPNEGAYVDALRKRAQGAPHIRFLDPVPMPEIVPSIAAYDLGVFLLQPNTFNHRHCLPNKLFEFIQARLGVVVSPVPDMSAVVSQAGVGAVATEYTPEALAGGFRSLTISDINRFKKNADTAAKNFCWETNALVIREKIGALRASS